MGDGTVGPGDTPMVAHQMWEAMRDCIEEFGALRAQYAAIVERRRYRRQVVCWSLVSFSFGVALGLFLPNLGA